MDINKMAAIATIIGAIANYNINCNCGSGERRSKKYIETDKRGKH